MHIPKKAIISASTEEEAKHLLRFLHENGYRWHSGNSFDDTKWHIYRERTCYALEPNRRICYSPRAFYQKEIFSFDDSGDSAGMLDYIPNDPALRFISVEAFIAWCQGDDETAEPEIDLGDLL